MLLEDYYLSLPTQAKEVDHEFKTLARSRDEVELVLWNGNAN